MKPHILFILYCIFSIQSLCGQLKIEDCYEKAEQNYPLIRQYGLIEKFEKYNLSNASKAYLPQMQFLAQASYQSEVTKLPIDVPGFKGLDKDRYGVKLDINQFIWDGGNTAATRQEIRSKSEVDYKNLEVSLYAIRDKVNQLFFGILLQEAMLIQNDLFQKELQRNHDQVSVYMDNGVANQADLDAVLLEQVKAEQQKTELTHNRQAYLAMLSALIGETLLEGTQLEMPSIIHQVNLNSIRRPELFLFDAQLHSLQAQEKKINSSLMPQFSAYFTGGYGRPGLNILETKFSTFYEAGIRMAWNISSLYSRKVFLRNVDIDRSTIDSQREAFLFNTNLDVINSNNEIKKIQKLIETDEQIISLRQSIKASSEVKAANGTLSILDLMKEVNAEQMAIQNKIVHKIQLAQAIYNLKYITNN